VGTSTPILGSTGEGETCARAFATAFSSAVRPRRTRTLASGSTNVSKFAAGRSGMAGDRDATLYRSSARSGRFESVKKANAELRNIQSARDWIVALPLRSTTAASIPPDHWTGAGSEGACGWAECSALHCFLALLPSWSFEQKFPSNLLSSTPLLG
jgi:hypothetical protein